MTQDSILLKGGKTWLQGKRCQFSGPSLVACSHREERLDSLYRSLRWKNPLNSMISW